ncbi:ATP-binding protein [Streptomyces sp. NPDC059096]|uniref:ATP-binding protein n=1 Tax=Streptomyces sp. NPDC059096 TaxID=3346727 RepID=UPI003694F90C
MPRTDHFAAHQRAKAQRAARAGCELVMVRAVPGCGTQCDDRYPFVARQHCCALLQKWGLDEYELLELVELVVSEVVTNALRYGEGLDVRLRMSVTECHALRLEVRDGSSAVPRVRVAGPLEERGRGLLIVDALVSACGGTWGVSEGGTTTWCQVPLEGAA